MNEYRKSGRQFNGKLRYAEEYKEFWKLEFAETMLRRKLYPFVTFGNEYIDRKIHTQHVIDCYQ